MGFIDKGYPEIRVGLFMRYFAILLHSIIHIFTLMKFMAVILAFYILTLNLTPCEDGSVKANVINDEMVQGVDDDHGHGNLDLCSPFCICHCCHMHATNFSPADIDLVSNTITTKVFLHFDSLGENIPNAILQPPRA